MAELVMMPKLGFDMKEGTFAAWVKNIGDTISSGDVIAEVETDKATVEVETYSEGTLLHVMASPGDILEVGVPIAIIGKSGEDFSGLLSGAPAKRVVEVEAAAPVEATAPAPTAASSAQKPVATNGGSAGAQMAGGIIKATPVARRIASERGINLNFVTGTGPGGRIVRQDVENFTPTEPAVAASGGTTAALQQPTYNVMTEVAHESSPTSKLRKTIARRMVESKQWVPHFTVTTSVDTTALLDLRKQINAKLDDANKITVNDMIVKATALTLVEYPNLNSHFHGDTIVRYRDINIGIAVALPQGGLINVVAKHADKTALATMAKKNKDMIAGARDGKVKPEDIEGSTFTVSNLGAFGVDHFSAIINPPEAGILAIGASQKVVLVADNGDFKVGNVMKVTISVDHRMSDGAEGAEFLRFFKDLLEEPLRLLV